MPACMRRRLRSARFFVASMAETAAKSSRVISVIGALPLTGALGDAHQPARVDQHVLEVDRGAVGPQLHVRLVHVQEAGGPLDKVGQPQRGGQPQRAVDHARGQQQRRLHRAVLTGSGGERRGHRHQERLALREREERHRAHLRHHHVGHRVPGVVCEVVAEGVQLRHMKHPLEPPRARQHPRGDGLLLRLVCGAHARCSFNSRTHGVSRVASRASAFAARALRRPQDLRYEVARVSPRGLQRRLR